MSTDLYAGQRYNFVDSTEYMHTRPEVGEWDAIAVTIPEGMEVKATEPVLIQGFFGFALQDSCEDEEDTIGVQMKPAEYEVGEDHINTSQDFKKGKDVYWDTANKRLTESSARWVNDISYSSSAGTMQSNLETALDALGFADKYSISEVGEVYTIEFDICVGETRLVADFDGLSISGEVSLERTQNFDPDEEEEEIWELDIGDATDNDFALGVDCLWVGKVSVKKDDDNVVWFLLASFSYQPTPVETTED